MGWTGSKGNWKTAKEYFERQFSKDDCILDYAIGETELFASQGSCRTFRTPVFCAVKEDDRITGCVVLLENTGNEWSHTIIGEDEGPMETRCPERILSLLTSARTDFALEWRRKCGENIQEDEPEGPCP